MLSHAILETGKKLHAMYVMDFNEGSVGRYWGSVVCSLG